MDHVDCCGQVDNAGLGAYNYSGEGESRTVYSSIPIVVIQQT
jgi:hypothetical protein